MLERQRRQNLFEDGNGVAPVEERRVRRQAQLVVVPPDQIEAESVKGANPDSGSLVGQGQRQTFGKLAGRAVREGQNKDGSGLDALCEERLDAPHEAARFPCAGSGPKLIRGIAMAGGALLGGIVLERGRRFGAGIFGEGGKKYGIKYLLTHERQWQAGL
jgi:hypothetical protein